MDLFKIAYRNLIRNRARTLLTVFSIGMAVVVLIALQMSMQIKEDFTKHSLGDRLITRAKYGLFAPMPSKYVEQVKSGQVGKLSPSRGESPRGIALRVSRAGKRVGKDAARGKLTYPGLLGVEVARRKAAELGKRAVAAAERLGSRWLVELARYVVTREK